METRNYIEKRRLEIAQNIRATRSNYGWTQERVAEYLGCSRRRVYRVEKGVVEFTIGELELLAKVFDIPLASFFS
jgi:transcriptional regulator with XRE-family HTH domain